MAFPAWARHKAVTMGSKKILYISGSLGLGHVTRDLAVAQELRRRIPEVEIFWLAAHPASVLIEDAGETLLPEAAQYANDNIAAERSAQKGFRLNLVRYLWRTVGAWKQNANIFRQVIARESFDAIVADEAYEIAMALRLGRARTHTPFVMILDFFGSVSLGWDPLGRLTTHVLNRAWAECRRFYANDGRVALFAGEPQDVADKRLGFLLPNARETAIEACQFIGYILPFNDQEYSDRKTIRAELGYGERPLIVCAIGGTSVGRELLTLCGQAYPLIEKHIPGLQMVLVCGPRLAAGSLDVPDGIVVRAYVPHLYRHFAASDLAIVQGGATTTLELTALKRPFLYFPLEGHFEQQVHVASRLARHRAGIRMTFRETTAEALATAAVENIGTQVDYAGLPLDGASKAAELIGRMI